MVEHQMIYSPERKKNNGYITNTTSHSFEAIQLLMVIIFSLCWPLILLHHVQNGFSSTYHVFPISAGFQLTLFLGVRRAGSLSPSAHRPVPGSRGSRQKPISLWGTLFQTSFKIYPGIAPRFNLD
jgi:hypothetical protein